LVSHIVKQLEGNQLTVAETIKSLETLTAKMEATRDLLELED
jgi:hypothetical protein